MLLPQGVESFNILADSLKNGHVCVMACDTIYGFVGSFPQTDSIIRKIKGREEVKPFLLLISSLKQLDSLGVVRPDSDILDFWPGPFTFIFPLVKGGTVACRVPEDERLRKLIDVVGTPLYSTSVNRTGFPSMNNPEAISIEFGEEVALIEDSGCFEGRQPSTLVSLLERPFKILRHGAGSVPESFLQ